MIKKTVVCDRCKKREPWVIIPKSDKLKSNTVLCKECAIYYYDLACNVKCANCGEPIMAGTVCRYGIRTFCSPLCAIQYIEGYNGDDGQRARYFTEEDEKMLLGEDGKEN